MKFRVRSTVTDRLVRDGAIVTGLGLTETAYDEAGTEYFFDRPWIAVRVEEDDIADQRIGRHPTEGWAGAALRPTTLEPLDDEARELLARATAATKEEPSC